MPLQGVVRICVLAGHTPSGLWVGGPSGDAGQLHALLTPASLARLATSLVWRIDANQPGSFFWTLWTALPHGTIMTLAVLASPGELNLS